jgi:hypothetical protein
MPESANVVLEAGRDEVWVGGSGGIAFGVGGAWRRMCVGEGIPGRTIYSLVSKDGSIWAGGSPVSVLKRDIGLVGILGPV